MTNPKPSVMDKVDFDLCHDVEDYNINNGTTTVTPPTMNPRIRKYDDYSTEDPQNADIPSKKPKITTSMGPPSHPLDHTNPSPHHHNINPRLSTHFPAQYSLPRPSTMNTSSQNINIIPRPTPTTREHGPPPSPTSTTSTTTTSPRSPQITDKAIPIIPVTLDELPSDTSPAATMRGSLMTPSRAVFTIYEDPDESDPMDIDPFNSAWMYPEDDKENEDRFSYAGHYAGSGSGNGDGNETGNEDGDGDGLDEDDAIEDERIRIMDSEAYTQQQSERALLENFDGVDNTCGNYYLSEDQDASTDDVGFYDTLMVPWESNYGGGGGGQRLHRRHSRRGLRWEEGS